MATDEIPADLLDLQRQHTAAVAAVKAAARAGEDIEALTATERALAVQLHRRRAGTPWESWEQQKRVRAAAAAGGGDEGA
jgi:hypothetical protein